MTDFKGKSEISNSINNLRYATISRRSFLKGLLATGGALALSGCGEVETQTDNSQTVTEIRQNAYLSPGVPASPIKSPSYIIPDYVHCIGCRACMVACTMKHYNEPDFYQSNIKVYDVYVNGGIVDIPILCMKCSDSPCMAACPPKAAAMSKDETTGAILIDNDKCTACGLCVEACAEERTGCLSMSREGDRVVGLCDLCGGEPECVLACPEQILQLMTQSMDGASWALKPDVLAQRIGDILYTL